MSVTAGVSDTVIAVRDKLRGKIGQTKVKRYWPGKAPEWADDGDEDADIRTSKAALEAAFPSRDDGSRNHIVKGDDRRLRRLAENRGAEAVERLEFEEMTRSVVEKRRRIREQFVATGAEKRRRGLKRRWRMKTRSGGGGCEYETDSEETQMSERDTIAEREKIEEEERAVEELVKRRVQERKVETKQIVVEEIRKDLEVQKNLEAEADVADVETDDDLNNADEYEAWKAREIARIKRDREDRDAMLKEREEIERVRNMTEEERREWERKNPKQNNGAPKQKWRFMQKYYHKGAFFQDDPDDTAGTAGADGVYRRDYSSPTGEDKMDKTILPKVMQVKHFGRSGRTKWTHLVNEDTTDWNNPWTYNDTLRAKYNSQMAGHPPPGEDQGKTVGAGDTVSGPGLGRAAGRGSPSALLVLQAQHA
ncbi:microfibrillar-associated protein 1-like protein [Tanacetum coccineum]|uniref:Microfibrillar-associated protein 1-like protein n=1 Tax=Tanacetum coccineum TaxID=301880 RepID=A0ABQ5GQ89_9ASTR